jgi:hypothetical protein
MDEQFVELASPDIETVAVVVDASDSAEKNWPIIVELTKKIFLKTPAEVQKKLFFLCNPLEYDYKKFEENAGKWWKQNSKKGSFITPVLNQIQSGKIVIIGSGRIFDLEDWTTSELSKKITFVKLDESMRGDLDIGTEIEGDAFDGQLLNLHNRILSVKISGDGFLPYYWDNTAYAISSEGDVALTSSKAQNFSIRIAAFGDNISATLEKVEGTECIPLNPVNTKPPGIIDIIEKDGTDWIKLEKDENETFKNHINSEEICCPVCGSKIQKLLKCSNLDTHGTLLGWSIYRSLKKIKGFIIFKDSADGVYYKQYPSEIIKLADETIAKNKKSKAVICRYDLCTKKWIEQEDLRLYYPLKEGYYVSVI